MRHPSRRQEFLAGARGQLPLLLGVAPFGLAYGAFAIESGLSGGAAQAMSAVIFGGASQFVAVRLIEAGTLGIAVVLAVALVNLRHMLYSASLAPRVRHLDWRWRSGLAYLLTDEAYVIGITRYDKDDGAPYRHWFLFGTGVALWTCWQVTTALGIALGAAVPESWALDFALPLTFMAIVVPTLTTRPAMAAALVAGTVAVLGFDWPYGTGLFAGALAGITAALVVERLLGDTPESGTA